MEKLLALVSCFALCTSLAHAAEEPWKPIATINGIANAYQDVIIEGVPAKDGKPAVAEVLGPIVAIDPVAQFEKGDNAVGNCTLHVITHKGVKFCFSSAENVDAFKKSVNKGGHSKYEPFGGGYCTQGLSNRNPDVPNADPRTNVRLSTIWPLPGESGPGQQLVGNGGFGARATCLGEAASCVWNAGIYYRELMREHKKRTEAQKKTN